MHILFSSDDAIFGATDVSDGPFPPLSFAPNDVDAPDVKTFFAQLSTVVRANELLPTRIVSCRMSHSANVEIVTSKSPDLCSDVDGLVTHERRTLLAVTGADCAPIFVADPTHHAIGLAHSGRKGTQANIAESLVERMTSAFDADPSNLRATIGPSICAQHYEVSEEMALTFPSQFVRGRHPDLPGMIYAQLCSAGIPTENISDVHECTFEHPDRWFSWRRDSQDGRPLSDIRLQVFFAMLK